MAVLRGQAFSIHHVRTGVPCAATHFTPSLSSIVGRSPIKIKPAVDRPDAEGAEPRRPSGADPVYVPLGPVPHEDESDHLDRVAAELAAGNAPRARQLRERLASTQGAARMAAAAELGSLGGRDAIGALRSLLEGPDPASWELAVHGLRQSKERDGWLCLESVAQESVSALSADDPAEGRAAALRLLMMGRTKTMDRLFRAADGHSRSIPQKAAQTFIETTLASIAPDQARVMSLRLGAADGYGRTPAEVAAATGLSVERIRELEGEAWAAVQSPRPWSVLERLLA